MSSTWQFTEEKGYGECDDCEELPRTYFDYFVPSILSVFVVMTGAWVDPMVACLDVAGASSFVSTLSLLVRRISATPAVAGFPY